MCNMHASGCGRSACAWGRESGCKADAPVQHIHLTQAACGQHTAALRRTAAGDACLRNTSRCRAMSPRQHGKPAPLNKESLSEDGTPEQKVLASTCTASQSSRGSVSSRICSARTALPNPSSCARQRSGTREGEGRAERGCSAGGESAPVEPGPETLAGWLVKEVAPCGLT